MGCKHPEHLPSSQAQSTLKTLSWKDMTATVTKENLEAWETWWKSNCSSMVPFLQRNIPMKPLKTQEVQKGRGNLDEKSESMVSMHLEQKWEALWGYADYPEKNVKPRAKLGSFAVYIQYAGLLPCSCPAGFSRRSLGGCWWNALRKLSKDVC